MTVALYVIVRRDLRVPPRLAASFAFAFALIALVKFVLAPFGLYEVNAVRALDDMFGSVADLGGAALTAGAVFASTGSDTAIAPHSDGVAPVGLAGRSGRRP